MLQSIERGLGKLGTNFGELFERLFPPIGDVNGGKFSFERALLDFPEIPEGHARYFVVVTEPYLKAGLHPEEGRLSQGETRYPVHVPYSQGESIVQSFLNAVNFACREESLSRNVVVSGVVSTESLHQSHMDKAIFISDTDLLIDSVYSVKPNGPKVEVKRVTRQYFQ